MINGSDDRPPPAQRDVRVDACRGIALWFIFLDHVPNNIADWLTLRHYGFSDTTEIFMFVSGITCAMAYDAVRRESGWAAVMSHTLRRSWDIYVAFLVLIVAIVALVWWIGDQPLIDATNIRVLLGRPFEAIAHAAVLQYRPVNTDVLPTFLVFHLVFAPLLWALLRAPDVTMACSVLLYAATRVFGWTVPQWPENDWYFNPLAWQVLVVAGGWWRLTGRFRFGDLVLSRWILRAAIAYLAFSLFVALGWTFKPVEALLPRMVVQIIYPIDKSDLDPLRLLHFLALAIVFTRFVPRDFSVLSTPLMTAAIRCGTYSLEIYCFGVLASIAAHAALVASGSGVAAQLALSIIGICALVIIATCLSAMSRVSKHHPKPF